MNFFFSAIREFSQKPGVTSTQHRLYSHNTFSLQMSQIQRTKQIKNIHSFYCFIQPASPWITYVAPQQYVSTLSYLLRTLSFWNIALYHSNYLPFSKASWLRRGEKQWKIQISLRIQLILVKIFRFKVLLPTWVLALSYQHSKRTLLPSITTGKQSIACTFVF